MTSFDVLLGGLELLCAQKRGAVIAIGGFGGSGKSTLANGLVDALRASVVQADDFYVPTVGHADLERIRAQVLQPLSLDRTARYQRFDWTMMQLADWREVPPGGPVIIEGVMVLSSKLLPYYDFTIWVDCPQDLAFQRGVTRDRDEYGVDTRQQWLDLWIPLEKSYADTQRPMELADFVLNNADGLAAS
jgi:uridine kinase